MKKSLLIPALAIPMFVLAGCSETHEKKIYIQQIQVSQGIFQGVYKNTPSLDGQTIYYSTTSEPSETIVNIDEDKIDSELTKFRVKSSEFLPENESHPYLICQKKRSDCTAFLLRTTFKPDEKPEDKYLK
ncbi:hypothetical protein [Rothia sp. 11254D007CT]